MQVSNLCHISPLGKSDHDILVLDYNAYLDYTKPKEQYLFNKGNYDAMRDELIKTNWSDEFVSSGQKLNTEELWQKLVEVIFQNRRFRVNPRGKKEVFP